MRTKPLIRFLPLLAAAALLAACAGTGGVHQTGASADSASHATLKQRAQQRWDYLIQHKAEKAYDYLTPGYRKAISRADYAKRKNHPLITWTAAHVGKVACESEAHCEVRMDIEYTTPPIGSMGSVEAHSQLTEQWLLLDGQWYHLPKS